MYQEVKQAIENFNSANAHENQAAMEALNTFLDGKLLPFVENLFLLINNDSINESTVRKAIAHIVRAFNIRRGPFCLIPKTWCSSQNLDFMHEVASKLLGYENDSIRQMAAFCVASMAAREVPYGFWGDFFPILFTEVCAKEKGIYPVCGCLNVLLEIFDQKIFVDSKTDSFISKLNPFLDKILESVFTITTGYIFDETTPIPVVSLSLDVFNLYFDFFGPELNNNAEVRAQAVDSIVKCMEKDDEKIYSLCTNLLLRFVKNHYYSAADKMEAIFIATNRDITEGKSYKKIRSLQLWGDIAKAENEIIKNFNFTKSIEPERNPEEEAEPELVPCCFVNKAEECIVPAAILLLRDNDKTGMPEEDEQETVQKAAMECLKNFEVIDPQNISPLLFNAFVGSVESEDSNNRCASVCALSCILPLKNCEAVYSNILKAMDNIVAVCMDPIQRVADNALKLIIDLVKDGPVYIENIPALLDVVDNSIKRDGIFVKRGFELISAIESNFDPNDESSDIENYIDNIMTFITTTVGIPVFRNNLVMKALFNALGGLINCVPFTIDISKIFLFITQLLTEEMGDKLRSNNELCISYYLSMFKSFIDRFLNISEDHRFNLFFFIPQMIEFLVNLFDSYEDVSVFSEGMIVADCIVLLIKNYKFYEDRDAFIMQLFGFIQKAFDSENNQVISNASVLLGDIFTVINAEPECAFDMFNTVSNFFEKDYMEVDDKLKLIVCLTSIVSVCDSFKYRVFTDLLLKLSELSKFKCDVLDPDEKSFAITVYTTVMSCYTTFINAYQEDDQERLENNIKQFCQIITTVGKLMPITDPIAVKRLIKYIAKVVDTFSTRCGERLQRNTPTVSILQFYMKSGNEEIMKQARSTYVYVMKN